MGGRLKGKGNYEHSGSADRANLRPVVGHK